MLLGIQDTTATLLQVYHCVIMARTAESRALQKCFGYLSDNLKYIINDILPYLRQHEVLPGAVLSDASTPGILNSEKITLVLNALHTQVRADQRSFHTFLDFVLKEKSMSMYQHLSFTYRAILKDEEPHELTTDYGYPVSTDQSEPSTKDELLTNTGGNQSAAANRDSGVSTQNSGLLGYSDEPSMNSLRKQMCEFGIKNTQTENTVTSTQGAVSATLPAATDTAKPRPNSIFMDETVHVSPSPLSSVHSNPAMLSMGITPNFTQSKSGATPLSKEEMSFNDHVGPSNEDALASLYTQESLSSQESVSSTCGGCDLKRQKLREMERAIELLSLKVSRQETTIAIDNHHYLKKVEEIQDLKEKLKQKKKEKHKLKDQFKAMQSKYKQLEEEYHLTVEEAKEVTTLRLQLEKTNHEKKMLEEALLRRYCEDPKQETAMCCTNQGCIKYKHEMKMELFHERKNNQELQVMVQQLMSRLKELDNALQHHCACTC